MGRDARVDPLRRQYAIANDPNFFGCDQAACGDRQDFGNEALIFSSAFTIIDDDGEILRQTEFFRRVKDAAPPEADRPSKNGGLQSAIRLVIFSNEDSEQN